jgi:predicted anti-sigma-YlaC factor YlaD
MKRLDCHTAEDWIIARLDEGLSDKREQLLETHLQQCAACRAFRDETAVLLSAVATDVPPDPGEDFWKRYDSSLDAKIREKAHNRAVGWWRMPLVMVAASLLVIVVGLGALMYYQQSQPDRLARSTVLFEEFGQLYGPVSDEGLNRYPSWDQIVAGFVSVHQEYGPDSLWFEAEDDPYQVFL